MNSYKTIGISLLLNAIILISSSCSSDPGNSAGETVEKTVPPSSFEPAGTLFLAGTVMNAPLIVNWNLQADDYQQLFTANHDLLATAANVYLYAGSDLVIIEQLDRSIISYHNETGEVNNILIEPLAEEAGPKDLEYHPSTDSLTFLRIEDNIFKLYLLPGVKAGNRNYLEIYQSSDPLVSPTFSNDGRQIHFAEMDLELTQATVKEIDINFDSIESHGVVEGDFQQLDVVGPDSRLIALTFQNLLGQLYIYNNGRWELLTSESSELGEMFAVDQQGEILAIPERAESGTSMLFVDLARRSTVRKAISLQAETIVPLLYTRQ